MSIEIVANDPSIAELTDNEVNMLLDFIESEAS
jgi:hypothetical protein